MVALRADQEEFRTISSSVSVDEVDIGISAVAPPLRTVTGAVVGSVAVVKLTAHWSEQERQHRWEVRVYEPKPRRLRLRHLDQIAEEGPLPMTHTKKAIAKPGADDAPEWPPVADAVELLRMMTRIRAFEEAALEHYRRGSIPGSLHVSIGQEACSAGGCAALDVGDLVIGTHRSHGDVIARGGDMRRMMAELFGRTTGYCAGKGGSMHILDADLGVIGANGIVGAGLPIAVGVGLWNDMRGTGKVVLAFFGDGAVAKGNFHEALTMAGMWQLPVIFFCQNNQYAVSMSITDVYPRTSIDAIAGGYGLPSVRVDGNDAIAVLAAAKQARQRCLGGGGPSMIVADTYRWFGHNVADPARYRDEAEVAAWRARDPIARLADELVRRGVLSGAGLGQLREEAKAEVQVAIDFAEHSPEPEPGQAFIDALSADYQILPRAGVAVQTTGQANG